MPSSTPPVLQINQVPPSVYISPQGPAPEAGYFSVRPRRHQNETPEGTALSPLTLPPTPPVPLLKSPPNDVPPKHDGNYFSPRPLRSPARITRATSPSDNLSNSSCLTPSAGSFHSCGTGRSPCSGSSSGYLTPPLFQCDRDNPPYKSRRRSSESLTMVKKLRRVSTMPDEKDARRKMKNPHRKRHKCRHRKVTRHEHSSRLNWWLPGCQVVPTAPRGQKDMCEGYGGQHTKFKLGKIDMRGRFSFGRRSNAMPGLVVRRWSSVEVGAHQIISELTSVQRPAVSAVFASPASDGLPLVPSFGSRFRSSTFTRGAIDNDIVRTVRDRLTLRKIPSSQLQTPVSITLRRASSRSVFNQNPSAALKSSEQAGESTPLARLPGDFHQRRPSAAYLITSQDIDSITQLIEENLKRKYEKPIRAAGTNSSSQNSRSPSVTRKGVVIPQSFPNLGLTITEGHTNSIPPQNPFEFLQVNLGQKDHTDFPRVPSQRSVHEVIWQGRGSTRSTSTTGTTEDDADKASPYCECSPEPGTSRVIFRQHECKSRKSYQVNREWSDAFDPKNANASINEWSMRCPQNDIAVVVTASDSESNNASGSISPFLRILQSPTKSASQTPKGRPKPKVPPAPRPAISEGNLQNSRSRGLTLEDVVSFPPLLARKGTEEWCTPLPQMMAAESPANSRSLYDIGLDANFGPLSSNTVTPKASQWYSPRPPEQLFPDRLAASQGIEFKHVFEERRKSVVKEHPSAVPRMSELSKMGSAIGTYGHERRTSIPKVQRVRTIDNIHKGERDKPPTKWRPPSVCPPRKSSSPSLSDDGSRQDRPPSPFNPGQKMRGGLLGRVGLIRDRTPSPPKVDPVGIYGKLTGAKRKGTLRDSCLLKDGPCKPHA